MKPRATCPLPSKCRTARGAERLRRLELTAAELFLDRGFEGVSMDELIHRVGGSRRNIYGHFGSKQGLFVETVQVLCAEVTSPLLCAPMADTGIRAGLTRYGHHALDVLLQPRALAMHRLMISEGQRFPELARSLLNSGCKAAAQALGGWMAGRQARGELRLDCAPVELAAQYFNLLVSGPQVLALVGEMPDHWQPEGIRRHVQTTVELFLHGAAAPPTGRRASE